MNTLKGIGIKLKTQDSLDVNMRIGFVLADTSETFGVEIRGGVCQFHPRLPQTTHATLITSKTVLKQVLRRERTLKTALENGSIKLVGNPENVEKFFGCFEGSNSAPPS